MRPERRAKRFCSTIGTGEKGRGIDTKVPAAVNAAKRAVRVIPTMVFLPEKTVMLLSIITGIITKRARKIKEGLLRACGPPQVFTAFCGGGGGV
jgi:hypothetical protein